MFKNLTRKQIIIIVAVAVVVIAVIIFIVVRKKKKRKQMELEQAEVKKFVPEPLPKEEAESFYKNAKKSQVIPEEDLKNESTKVQEAVVKPIQRPAQSSQSAQQKPQTKAQTAQPVKKEVPFTPIMEEDRELIDQMNKADQDRPGVSIGN